MKSSSLLIIAIATTFLLFSNCKKSTDTSVVKIHLPDEPDKLQPYYSSNAFSRQLTRLLFYTLMEYDSKTYQYSPLLAKSAPIITKVDSNANLLSFTYELLDEAKWDNGKPLLASDFEFTLKLILNPKTAATKWRPFFSGVKNFVIDPSNPKKFTIIAENDLLMADAFGSIYILPEYIYDPNGLMKKFKISELADAPTASKLAETDPAIQQFADFSNDVKFSRSVGSVSGAGPYSLQQWETGQFVLLKKKENWWGNNLKSSLYTAIPNQLYYKILKDDAATIAEIKNGNLDVVGSIKPDNFVSLQNDAVVKDKYNFENPATLQYSYYVFNTKNEKLSDVNVRKALAHLLDIDVVIKKVMKGFAKPVMGPILSTNPYCNQSLKPILFDPSEAKKLLESSGWKDSNGDGILDKTINGKSTDLKIQLLYAPQGAGKDVTLMYQENCRKAGVVLDIVPKDMAAIKNEVKTRNFEMYLMASLADLSTPNLYQAWHSASDTPEGSNTSGFGTPETDKMLETIRDTNDENLRKELYKKVQQAIYDAQPYIFIVNPTERIVINKKFVPVTTIKRTGFGGYVEEALAPK